MLPCLPACMRTEVAKLCVLLSWPTLSMCTFSVCTLLMPMRKPSYKPETAAMQPYQSSWKAMARGPASLLVCPVITLAQVLRQPLLPSLLVHELRTSLEKSKSRRPSPSAPGEHMKSCRHSVGGWRAFWGPLQGVQALGGPHLMLVQVQMQEKWCAGRWWARVARRMKDRCLLRYSLHLGIWSLT